jgi:hypothetical protein
VAKGTNILSSIPTHSFIKLQISFQSKIPLHEGHIIPIMYFDQLHTIARYLQKIQLKETFKRIHPDENKTMINEPIQGSLSLDRPTITKH